MYPQPPNDTPPRLKLDGLVALAVQSHNDTQDLALMHTPSYMPPSLPTPRHNSCPPEALQPHQCTANYPLMYTLHNPPHIILAQPPRYMPPAPSLPTSTC